MKFCLFIDFGLFADLAHVLCLLGKGDRFLPGQGETSMTEMALGTIDLEVGVLSHGKTHVTMLPLALSLNILENFG